MAAIRSTTQLFRPLLSFRSPATLILLRTPSSTFICSFKRLVVVRPISFTPVRAAASGAAEGGKKKSPARLAQVEELLLAAKERAKDGANEPIPKITIDHVTVNFARSGGPGGQNVNKVNTKVDMRFNVDNAYWLSQRVREKILQMKLDDVGISGLIISDYVGRRFFDAKEKNRINKDGELVISSTKTRTQKGNIEDALEKLQAIIDAASYVPPPPSEEQVKKIQKLAAIGEKKRLEKKKENSQKKAMRRSRDSWD